MMRKKVMQKIFHGENGVKSVMEAQLAGLFPVVADEGYNYVIEAQSEMVLSKAEYC